MSARCPGRRSRSRSGSRTSQPGDVILLNDPYHGGSHLPDLHGLRAGVRRRQAPALDHRARPSERHRRRHPRRLQSRAPPRSGRRACASRRIKLYEAGRPRDDLLDLLALNVRNPREFRGDLAAMLGAAHLGERRVVEAVRRVRRAGPSRPRSRRFSMPPSSRPAPWSRPGRTACSTARRFSMTTAMAAATSGSRQRSPRRAAISRSISPAPIRSRPSFVNSSHANMQAAVAMAFAYLIDADIPKNTGALRPAEGDRQAGHDRLGRSRPAGDAVHQPSLERDRRGDREGAVGVLSGARDGRLEPPIPDRDPGRGSAHRAAISSGTCSRRGPAAARRPAATAGRRSANGTPVGGLKFGSIEVAEVRFPLYFRQHEFRPGSGGDGQYRGGLGVALDMVLETEKPATRQHRGRRRAPRSRAACSAARTASRIAIGCCRRAASRACCAPRRSASSSAPAIASKSARPAAAGGDRRAKRSRKRARSATREQGLIDVRGAAVAERCATNRRRRRRNLHRPGCNG